MHEPDLIIKAEGFGFELYRSKNILKLTRLERKALILSLGDPARGLAARGGKLALEKSHAGLARIPGDDLAQCRVVRLDLARFQTVLFALLGQKMALCDLHLLLVSIAVQLYDLHTVEQRAWYRICGVCRGDEEHTRKVYRYLKEIVAERAVLLTVERFQQRRARIAAVVGAELVDLVEHHERVHAAALDNTADNAPRHRAYIRFAVAAYLGLIMHAAERHAAELAVCGAGNAHGYAGLARSRRADEAQKPALYLRGKLLDREVLKHTLLDLVQTVMLIVQQLARLRDVDALLRGFSPRYLKAHVQISAQHRCLG